MKLGLALMLVVSLGFVNAASAETAIIVHAENDSQLDLEAVHRIYMGKQSSFSEGFEAVPINLTINLVARDSFDTAVLGKSSRQIKAYWSKLVFTGKGTPPKEVDSEKKMLELVTHNRNMIGYVDAELVDDNVRVIHTF